MTDGASPWARGAMHGAGGHRPRVKLRMNGWIEVCALEDIVPDTGVCALVNGAQVAVFRVDGDRVYAIGNHDPFSRANVLSRA